MAFLAALALGASLIADRAAEGWQAGLANRITVQIAPPETGDPRRALAARKRAAALSVLNATPGIAHAASLSDKEIEALVEPWIGKAGMVDGIPLPRLIDADITPGADIDMSALTARVKAAAPHAVLDDHRRWIARLEGLADTVRYAAYGILLPIAGATAAVVTFATHAGLDAHHEMVALLHQMGALRQLHRQRSIERHYFLSALAAGSLARHGVAALLFVGAVALRIRRRRGGALPAGPPSLSLAPRLPWLAAVPGGQRADRLGDRAHFWCCRWCGPFIEQ